MNKTDTENMSGFYKIQSPMYIDALEPWHRSLSSLIFRWLIYHWRLVLVIYCCLDDYTEAAVNDWTRSHSFSPENYRRHPFSVFWANNPVPSSTNNRNGSNGEDLRNSVNKWLSSFLSLFHFPLSITLNFSGWWKEERMMRKISWL